MTTKEKVLITILLALIAFLAFGCAEPETPQHPPITLMVFTSPHYETDVLYLQKLYAIYNNEYFQDRLPKDIKIGTDETEYMASTTINDLGFDIEFNLKYTLAPRTAESTMLHEMCHVKTWDSENDRHGKKWRTCMLQLDTQGAFRNILIDNYSEGL